MKYFLYKHTRLDTNEVFYIGIGTKQYGKSDKTIYKRAYSKYSRNKFWNYIVNKTNYNVELLLESDDKNLIYQKEIELIKLYGRRDLKLGTLCNLSNGGEDIAEKMVKKGRTKEHYDKMRGSRNYNARINEDIARSIKLDMINKVKRSTTLEKYNISKTLYKDIQRNKTWRHVQIL